MKKQNTLSKTIMVLLIMIVPMSLDAQTVKNPKRLIQKAMNDLKKGKGDSLQKVLTIALHIGHEKVKKKTRVKSAELINSAHQEVVEASESLIKKQSRCVQLDQSISPYQRFKCLESLLEELNRRIKLADAMREAEAYFSVNVSDRDMLQEDYNQHMKIYPIVQDAAVADLYKQADSLIVKGDSKHSFRQAYYIFHQALSVKRDYLDLQTRIDECLERGTVTVAFATVTSESGGSLNVGAARELQRQAKIAALAVPAHTFLKVIVDDQNAKADVTIHFHLLNSTVDYVTPPSRTFDYENTITVDGKDRKVRATITETYKEAKAEIHASVRVEDHTGEMKLSEMAQSLDGTYYFQSSTGRLTGDIRTVRKKSRWRIREGQKVPHKSKLMSLAVKNTEKEIQSLIQTIQKAL